MERMYVRGAIIIFCAWLTWVGAFQWKATTNDQQNETAEVIVTSDGLVQGADAVNFQQAADNDAVNFQQAADNGAGKKVDMVVVPSGATILTQGDGSVQHDEAPLAVQKAAHRMVEAINHLSTRQVQAIQGMMHPAQNAKFLSNETEREITQMDANARKMLGQVLQGQLESAEATAIELERETKALKAHDPNFDPDTNRTQPAALTLASAQEATKSCSINDAPPNKWTDTDCYPCDCALRYGWCMWSCNPSNCRPSSHWCYQVAVQENFWGMLQGQGDLLEKHVALGVVESLDDEQGQDLGTMRNDDVMKRPDKKRRPGQVRNRYQGKPMSRAAFVAAIQRASQKVNASIDTDLDATVQGKACA